MTTKLQGGTATKYFVLAQLAEAVSRCAEAEAEVEVARKMRDDAMRRAKSQGVTLRELAALSGLSKARVQQLAPGEEAEEIADEMPEATSAFGG